jgi:death on curing protein
VREALWLLKEFILALHERLLAEFGGLDGIRDEGRLESALGKPQNLFGYGKNPTVVQFAASYAAGIIKNHPFLDGKKRTGFAAAIVFLETNGYRMTASEVEATAATLGLAAGKLSEEDYGNWLKEHCEPSRKTMPRKRRSNG